MKKIFRPLAYTLLFLVVFFAASCARTAENEHLPEYCQTYSGFTGVASKDLYDLMRETYPSQLHLNRSNYDRAITSTIELEFIVDDPTREIDLSGIQCFQNLTYLTLSGRSFKDLSPISALKNIQSIELNGTSVVSIDSFKNLSKIKSLVISDTRTLQSVDGVEEMTKLTTLDLSNNGLVRIDGLNNLTNLQNLYLNDNDIQVFPSINALDDLRYLDISDNNINELGDLSGLTSLVELDAENNEICDISAFGDLTSLQILVLSNNDLGCGGIGVSPDFDSLQNATQLIELRLDNNNLTSIDGLRGRNISLTTLYLNDNQLTDITPISEYTDITTLVIDNNNIVNINDLSGMTGLTSIDLSDNLIVDFSDLRSIAGLETIDLSNNRITAIPDLSSSWDDLTVLDLRSNVITDTSGLAGHQYLETVYLMNNGLEELSGINNLPALDELVLFDEEYETALDEDDQNPNEIRILRDSFYNVPQLVLTDEEDVFTLWFDLEENIEIYNSIKDLAQVGTIDFTGMEVNVIDEFSIVLPYLNSIYVSSNNIEDIRFLLGNPSLERINISDNPIENLSVLSGAETSDFDNLIEINALGITGNNNVANAFIDLPAITSINLFGSNILAISNSFNDLATLEELTISADNLLSVEDSFNNLFSEAGVANSFDWSDGKIGIISNSFNDGYFEYIDISSQQTTLETTSITGSFKNLIITSPNSNEGLLFNSSSFTTISDSFINVDAKLLHLGASDIETITASFDTLTLEEVNLLNNPIATIEDSFDAIEATTLNISNNSLTSIDSSFTNSVIDEMVLSNSGAAVIVDSFITLTVETFNMSSGSVASITTSFDDNTITTVDLSSNDIASIDTSFTNSTIDTIDLSENGAAVIVDSFDTLTTTTLNMSQGNAVSVATSFTNSTIDTIDLSNNDIITVESSFSTLTSELVDLSSNAIDTINLSFTNGTIDDLDLSNNVMTAITASLTSSTFVSIDLSVNQLQTVPVLQDLISVEVIDLSNNVLTTVSFLDGIDGVTELHIDNQYIPGVIPTPTLTTLDGVNNMELLTTFTYSNIGITAINGLINIGVTELDFSRDTNILEIVTINSGSFADTPLTVLNIDGHELVDVGFLSNLTVLEELSIGIDKANLSDFQGLPFETTLTDLTISNIQTVTDYSYLSDYDVLETFTLDISSLFTPAFTTVISNFDGMDSLSTLSLPFEYISDVSDSFNNMPAYNPGSNVLINIFDNTLATINNSFDMYGTVGNTDSINIPITVTLVDSFNNVGNVNVVGNDNELTPNFDLLSFDNMESIHFEFADYSSFSFLDGDAVSGYTSLSTVTIDDLDVSIIDLSNNNIDNIIIDNADASVDTLTLVLNNTATMSLVSQNTTTLTIDTNAVTYDIDAPNADIVLNSTVSTLNLTADVDDFTLNNNTVTTVDFSNFTSTILTFNTNALTTVSRSTTTETNAAAFTVNTLETILDISTKSTNLVINDDNATTYTLVVNNGTTTINGAATDITVSLSGTQLDVNYNELEDFTISGTIPTVNVSSTNLDTFTSTATITDLDVTSNVASLALSGDDITNLTLQANNVTSLSLDMTGATVDFSTTSNQALVTTIDVDTLNFTGDLVPSISLNTTSVVPTLNLVNNDALNTLSYNDSTLTTVTIITNQTTFNVSGTTGADFDLSGAELDTLTIDSSLSSFVLNDIAVTLSADIIASSIDITNTSLVILNLAGTSDISNLNIVSLNAFTTLNSNDSTIDVLTVDTDVATLTIDAINALDTTITGNDFTSVNLYLGTNPGVLNSNNTAALSLNSTASTLDLQGSLTTLTLNSATVIDTLNLNTSSVSNIVGNNATITLMDIANISTDTDISGTAITELVIDDTVSVLDLDLELATIVSITTNTGITLTADVSEITLIASNGDSTITSNTIDSLILELGSNNLDFTGNKTNLNLTIDGTAGDVTLSGTDFDNITTTANTNLETVILNNTDIVSLDFTLGSVDTLQVQTTQTDFTVVGDETTTFIIVGANISTVDISSTAPASTLTLENNTATVTIDGTITSTSIDNDSLNSLVLTGLTTSDITIDSLNATLTITGNVATTTINNNNLNDLTITGYTTTDLTIQTLQTALDVDGNPTNLVVNDANLDTLTGFTVTDLDVTSSSASLTLDGSATNVTLSTNSLGTLVLTNLAATTIDVTSTNTTLDVQGTASDLTINNDSLTGLTFTTFSATNLDLTLNTSNLASLDMGGSVTGDFILTTNLASFTLNANSTTLDYSALVTSTLDLTSTTINDLTTNVEVLDLTVSTANLAITGANISTVNGSVDSIEFLSGNATLTLDLDVAGTLDVDSSGYTGISLTGAKTINVFTPNNSSLVSIDTNDVTINTFAITTTESTFEYAGNLNVTIDYTDTTGLSLTLDTVADVIVNITNASVFAINGTVDNLTITGANLTNGVTSSLNIDTSLTMNDTLITSLAFLSDTAMTNIDTITINTLDSVNIEGIINTIDGYTVTLVSPIVDQDVHDYYYEQENTRLTDLESIDNARYDGFRDTAINNAWTVILTNSFMDQLDETTTKNEIDTQVYQTATQYLALWLTSESYADETAYDTANGAGSSDAARASIQATLDDPALTIVEATLEQQVTDSIDSDATDYADDQLLAKAYTLS